MEGSLDYFMALLDNILWTIGIRLPKPLAKRGLAPGLTILFLMVIIALGAAIVYVAYSSLAPIYYP